MTKKERIRNIKLSLLTDMNNKSRSLILLSLLDTLIADIDEEDIPNRLVEEMENSICYEKQIMEK